MRIIPVSNQNPLAGRILMVGTAMPEARMVELALRDRYPALQGHKHQWAMIGALEKAGAGPVELVSFTGISDFPRHPTIFLKGGRWSHRSGARDVWVSCINVFGFKQLTRFIGLLPHILRWLVRHRNETERFVFLYNSISAPLYAVLVATALIKARRICILADYPSKDVAGEGIIYRTARRLDRFLQTRGLRKMHGIIALSEHLASDLAPGVPYIVMEGIVSQCDVCRQEKPLATAEADPEVPFVVMYAGRLEVSQGVDLLLNGFALVEGNWELWVCGRGALEGRVKEVAQDDPRVKYLGFRPNAEMLDLSRRAALLVCPRLADAWDTKYSFPSKMIEYMATGVPVLATRLPVIPKEYDPYVFWIETQTPEGLATAFRAVRAHSSQELVSFGCRARQFVLEQKDEQTQAKKIRQMMERICSSPGPQQEGQESSPSR